MDGWAFLAAGFSVHMLIFGIGVASPHPRRTCGMSIPGFDFENTLEEEGKLLHRYLEGKETGHNQQ